MFDVSYAMICGRVAVEPESKQTDEGKQLTTFSVAVNVGKDRVNFWSVAAFGFLSQYASEQLSKGLRVTVMGRCEQVISKEGKHYMRLTADSIFPGVYKPMKTEGSTDASNAPEDEYV